MSDKSPRQQMAKKSGKTLKEKRAAKKAKEHPADHFDAVSHVVKH